MEGLAKSNSVLTRYNYAVMAQLAQMTVIMNVMQAQLKTLDSAQKKSDPKNKALLLELREQFQSRKKKLLSKESGTSIGIVLQKGWVAVKRDVNDA